MEQLQAKIILLDQWKETITSKCATFGSGLLDWEFKLSRSVYASTLRSTISIIIKREQWVDTVATFFFPSASQRRMVLALAAPSPNTYAVVRIENHRFSYVLMCLEPLQLVLFSGRCLDISTVQTLIPRGIHVID